MTGWINFKEETLKAVEDIPSDLRVGNVIVSIGKDWCRLDRCIDNFDFKYNNDYGGSEINENIIISDEGAKWFMYRHVYDGAEWWQTVIVDHQNLRVFSRVDLQERYVDDKNKCMLKCCNCTFNNNYKDVPLPCGFKFCMSNMPQDPCSDESNCCNMNLTNFNNRCPYVKQEK
jgi:hypothetical protein